MKKTVLLIVLLTVLIALIACKSGEKQPDETSGPTSEEVTETETVRRERGEQVDMISIAYQQTGLTAFSVSTTDEYVCEGTAASTGNVSIRAFEEGTAVLTVSDYWGHTAEITVTVEDKTASATVTRKFSDASVANVRFFGAKGNSTEDDTEAIQSAIDSLPEEGGEVLIPVGVYPVRSLVLRNGVHVRLQGTVERPADGYTDELAGRVNSRKEFAVLVSPGGGNFFYNHTPGGPGNLGASDITISGGVLDMNGSIAAGKVQIDTELKGTAASGATGTGSIIFSCGQNFVIENVIFKDSYNGHVMQLCGVQNVTIRDCVFAGFVIRPEVAGSSTNLILTRELIQIEYAHSGAIPPSTFEPGEFYYCRNVSITGCYFGDSDKCAYPLTCIGQHGLNGTANCDGLVIENNVFDNPYYCALRLPNYINVSIRNNRFLSDQKGRTFGYFIELLMMDGDKSFTDSAGATVLVAKSYENDGLRNIDILENEFTITGNSNKRVLSALSTGYLPGANAESRLNKQVPGELTGKSYTGFLKRTNYIGNLNFSGNSVTLRSTGAPSDSFIAMRSIVGLTFADNSFDTIGSFSRSWNGISGVVNSEIVSENEIYGLSFNTSLKDHFIYLPDGNGGTIRIASDGSSRVLSLLRGSADMTLSYTIDGSHNVVVSVTCADGKTFSGWTLNGTEWRPGSTFGMSASMTLTAVCR